MSEICDDPSEFESLADEAEVDALARQLARPAVHAGWQRPAREAPAETLVQTPLGRTGVARHTEP